jgi:hypothetical protein
MIHIERGFGVVIREKLYDGHNKELLQAFVMPKEKNSAHIINDIPPVFAPSFLLADHI